MNEFDTPEIIRVQALTVNIYQVTIKLGYLFSRF
jgi:hypothetical protein